MKKSLTYHDLLAACQQPGCPVCRFVQNSVQQELKNLFYENVNDPETRLQLRETMGFCFEHSWLLLDTGIGDALGVSIIYHDVLGFALKHLKQADDSFRPRGRLAVFIQRFLPRWAARGNPSASAFIPKKPCRICQQQEGTTQRIMEVLTDSLPDKTLQEALAASSGVCLLHLRLAFERVRNRQAYNTLVTISQEHLEALRQELAEFIRKNDYRFTHEVIGPEGNAWRRAVGIVVGEKGQ